MYHLRWHCLIVGLSRNLWNVQQREEVNKLFRSGGLVDSYSNANVFGSILLWEYTLGDKKNDVLADAEDLCL